MFAGQPNRPGSACLTQDHLRQYDHHVRWIDGKLILWAASGLAGVGLGTFGWSLWWPHSDRGIGMIGLALAVIGLGAVAAASDPDKHSWWPMMAAVVMALVATYAGLALATRSRCGDCPPWSMEQVPVRVTVAAGEPSPPSTLSD